MKRNIFKIGHGALLLFLIIYVGSLIDWFFYPFVVLFQTLFVPIIISVFLFYLLRPLVRIMNKKLSRGTSILLLYFLLVCLLAGLAIIIGPILQRQFNSLTNNMPHIISEIHRGFRNIQQSNFLRPLELDNVIDLEALLSQIGDLINQAGKSFVGNVANFIGVFANAVLVLIIVPFILFYILKDGDKFKENILNIFNVKQQKDIQLIFNDIDKTLSSYIQGQGIVCLCVAILCYVAFLIVGLDYALLLAVIAGITNIIPYVGPWIGTVPAVIVGLFQSPIMALVIIILVVVIQQIESNLISPQVIGKKLQIHPITIMFLILISGRLIGLMGMILAVPFYGICRVIFVHSIRIWKSKNGQQYNK